MSTITVAVHGLGNIGRCVIDSLSTAPDMTCIGIIRRASSIGGDSEHRKGCPEYPSLEALIQSQGKPQVCIVCGPSRAVADDAALYLGQGIHTVDSFDIHSQIPQMLRHLDSFARKANCSAITAAGWDPGTDSVLRVLFEAMVPVGTTFTNFGRGRSMGHSVAVRAIEGVEDAVSITIPIGGGRHSRLVYVLPKHGANFDDIKTRIAQDPYFSHDPLDLRQVATAAELASVADTSHGVRMERTGASGNTNNQQMHFDMRIDNPALTAQVLVSCARAVTRMPAGAHTLIDIPPVALLPGDRMTHIARLV